jgi:hypothetical protein
MKMKIRNITGHILGAAATARIAERPGTLAARTSRNEIAEAIFRSPKRRKVTHLGVTVETWWDRQSLNYITQVIDAGGRELKDAHYTGNSGDAAVAHLWALYVLIDLPETK